VLGERSTAQEWFKYLVENPENSSLYNYIVVTYNSIGMLLKNKILSHELVFSIHGPHFVIWTWEKLYPSIEVNRELSNYKELMGGFEYLYNEAIRQYPDLTKLEDYRQKYSDFINQEISSEWHLKENKKQN
jgi:hypothetical protein